MRYTEVFKHVPNTTRRNMIQVMQTLQDKGQYLIPIDHWTDCRDFWELCCGIKGVPADKSQRLSVLMMREDRLTGKIRNFILVGTTNMVGDGLTKTGMFPEVMMLQTTGLFRVTDDPKKDICLRTIKDRRDEITEGDLMELNL